MLPSSGEWKEARERDLNRKEVRMDMTMNSQLDEAPVEDQPFVGPQLNQNGENVALKTTGIPVTIVIGEMELLMREIL